jgi:hypothetical protein
MQLATDPVVSEELWLQRMRLKEELAVARTVFTVDGYVPRCSFCGKGIPSYNGIDMHEALITRGDIRGVKHLEEKIYTRYNCVLLHHVSCHVEAATKQGHRTCVRSLVALEGTAVLEWLYRMNLEMRSSQVDEQIRMVKEIIYG